VQPNYAYQPLSVLSDVDVLRVEIHSDEDLTPMPDNAARSLEDPFTPRINPPDQYADLLDRIEEHHEELRDAREKLIGVRFRLRARREELRTTREKAAVQAGSAFDLVKRFMLGQGYDLPQNVRQAIEDADNWRDRLGIRELEFEQAEEAYNLEEWKYTEEEKKFVDDLSTNTPLAPASLAPPFGAFDTRGLTRLSFGISDADDALAVPEVPTISPNVLDLTHLSEDSRKTEQSRVKGLLHFTAPPKRNWASMFHATTLIDRHTQFRLRSRPYSETDLGDARLKWSDTRNRIEEWLLETLEHSGLHRARLRSQLSNTKLDDETWWKLVCEHWSSDTPEGEVIHTGDTVASTIDGSQPVSATAFRKIFEECNMDDPEARLSSATPLVSDDRVVDALENMDFPSTLSASDLFDRTPKRVTFAARVDSTSTQPTAGSTTSSQINDSSISTLNKESSYTSSGGVASIRPVDPLGASRTRYDRELDELARPGNAEFAMAPPLFHTGLVVATEASIAPNIASRKTSLTSNVSASLRSTASTTAVLGIEHDTSTPDPTEVHGSGSPINRPPDEEDPIYSWAEHRLRAARGRTRHPFAPFIRVKSPEPWSLPLLRLTPLPSPDSENRSLAASLRRLENVPFVAFSDSPFRLPGPSKFLALSSADRIS
jgi:hypothetical protein